MARDFDKRIEELGATRLFDRGEGDDDSSLEEDFERWKAKACGAVLRVSNCVLIIWHLALGPNLSRVWIGGYSSCH